MRCSTGLNLGLLFFFIYINDLPNCLPTSNSARVSMFADDTNISSHGANIREINESLNENLEKSTPMVTFQLTHIKQ